jgi:SAM-dependent methyltransferase
MNSPDPSVVTLQTYQAHAAAYIARSVSVTYPPWYDLWLTDFCQELTSGGPDAGRPRVLEIGSAHGRDARVLEQLGADVQRSDVTPAFADYLRAQGQDVWSINVLTDPPVDHRFDGVLAAAVLHHFTIRELRIALGWIRSVLRPGGVFAFCTRRGDGDEYETARLGAPRYFRYHQPAELWTILDAADCEVITLTVRPWRTDVRKTELAGRVGYGHPAYPGEWIYGLARRSADAGPGAPDTRYP